MILINCYRSPANLYVSGGLVLISQEGVTQGDPTAGFCKGAIFGKKELVFCFFFLDLCMKGTHYVQDKCGEHDGIKKN